MNALNEVKCKVISGHAKKEETKISSESSGLLLLLFALIAQNPQQWTKDNHCHSEKFYRNDEVNFHRQSPLRSLAGNGEPIRLESAPCKYAYLSVSASTPGSFLPSRNSRLAPPPVLMWVIWSATPAWLMAETESPPPMMEMADLLFATA